MIIAVALLFSQIAQAAPEVSVELLQSHLQALTSKEVQGRYPGSPGHQLAKKMIMTTLQNQGLQDVHSTLTAPRNFLFWKKPKVNKVENIFALYPSSEASDECLVYSAHYDHAGPDRQGRMRPGATDNASGVAALLEFARLLTTSGLKLPVDIWLLFPDQEENYIAGSPAAVQHLKKKCTKIWANVNLDIVGTSFFEGMEGKVMELTGNGTPMWAQMLGELQTPGLEVLQNDIYIIEPLGRLIPRSDYASFREQKIPFVFYTSGTPWFYHTAFDTIERVDFAALGSMVLRLWQVAQSFESRAQFSDLGYVDLVEQDYLTDAERFANLVLRPLLDRAEANRLTPEEEVKWEERIAELEDGSPLLKRWQIHQAILALLSQMEKRAELEMGHPFEGPLAYFKTALGH